MEHSHREKAIRQIIPLWRRASEALRRDQLTLYAAQASFFLLLSAIPLLILTLNVSRLLSKETVASLLSLLFSAIPEDFHGALSILLTELEDTDGIPLLSVTAAAALWSASRGMAALRRGLSGVYGIRVNRGFLRDSLLSLLYTAAFVILIPASLLLLVFGVSLADAVMSAIPSLEGIITRLLGARGLLMFGFLSLLFTLGHRLVRRAGSDKTPPVCAPGGMLSAAGWMLFSYLYSLYIRYFPRASYLYGSMAMLVIMMLWLYFCMIIFLLGAEVNKLLQGWIDGGKKLQTSKR